MKYLVLLLMLALSGCTAQIGASGELYWPKENKDNVWRSRAEFHRKTSQTDANMGGWR